MARKRLGVFGVHLGGFFPNWKDSFKILKTCSRNKGKLRQIGHLFLLYRSYQEVHIACEAIFCTLFFSSIFAGLPPRDVLLLKQKRTWKDLHQLADTFSLCS